MLGDDAGTIELVKMLKPSKEIFAEGDEPPPYDWGLTPAAAIAQLTRMNGNTSLNLDDPSYNYREVIFS